MSAEKYDLDWKQIFIYALTLTYFLVVALPWPHPRWEKTGLSGSRTGELLWNCMCDGELLEIVQPGALFPHAGWDVNDYKWLICSQHLKSFCTVCCITCQALRSILDSCLCSVSPNTNVTVEAFLEVLISAPSLGSFLYQDNHLETALSNAHLIFRKHFRVKVCAGVRWLPNVLKSNTVICNLAFCYWILLEMGEKWNLLNTRELYPSAR